MVFRWTRQDLQYVMSMLSMLQKTVIGYEILSMGPCLTQVTSVESPLGSSVNSTMLCVSNGLTKSSLIATLDGGTDSAISMRPWPTSLLPSHAYTAPLPLVTALKVSFMVGSFFSQDDQVS